MLSQIRKFSFSRIKTYVLIRVWNVKFMPRTKKNFKLGIYYHFLIKYGVSSCQLVTICTWHRNCATCNHEIGDSKHEDYTNKQQEFLRLDLDTLVNTRIFYENLCECVCVQYRYSRAIQSMLFLSLSLLTIILSCLCHFIFNFELDMSVLSFKFGRLTSFRFIHTLLRTWLYITLGHSVRTVDPNSCHLWNV